MRTQQEIFKEVMALPRNERVQLLRKLERNIESDDNKDGFSHDRRREEVIAERKLAIDRLRGIASVPGKKPPTDEEWREERTNYLLEKHK